MAFAGDDGMTPPAPAPITIPQAVEDLQKALIQIRRKLKTLIDWYIYPVIVPNEIKAYDPRLQILESRLISLSTLSYQQLPYLFDNSDGIAAHYLLNILDQLLNSMVGIQKIFVEHYDRDLDERRPFGTIWDTLQYRSDQLKLVPQFLPHNPRRQRPEDLRTNELGNFCRGALQMINNRDKGRISHLENKDLLPENKRKLKAFGGAFLFWECPECAYRVRYHVANSSSSNIHTATEIREHNGLGIQYRSSFLARCHLYLPLSEKSSTSSTSSNRRQSQSISTLSSSSPKYGCVFCFACGRDLERGDTAFNTPRELAEHIVLEHKRILPPSMILHRFLVAVEGKMHDPCQRWDLNLL
ncbi:uncharacterized protein Z518_08470 [Rhinocladiella mackenziei CBS 650.93]|uniref:Rhinocladiella mackenziei CBS 650.93 unplaced genomic scaffold supercont1.6, whole genome shotgun sequence n=1 Tax=Rhinocladiella mackenziei CBS 650.93 TaxID=1442369 RepID=A0A0D2I9L8_9EURO|nr:uncharacterized protein Z518_08470 [Rhinocladiella mackenziei CBS 650.93]KIX02529.1 hypothetical protein Z518_08470 [Rhinocladiella mackenziei CBS 650.93]